MSQGQRDILINGESLVTVKGNGALAASGSSSPSLWELGLASDPIRITPKFVHEDVHIDDFGPQIPVETIWMLAEANIRMTLMHFDIDILDRCIVESMAGGAFVGAMNPNVGFFPSSGLQGVWNYASGFRPSGATSVAPIFNSGFIVSGIVVSGTAVSGYIGAALPAFAGALAPAGTMMGGGVPFGVPGNHYISLTVRSPMAQFPWRFRTCYLADRPVEIPLGTKRSAIMLNWRCIPYVTYKYTTQPSTGGGSGTTVVASELLSSGVILWDHTPDIE